MHAISCQADESRQTITDVCVVDAVWQSRVMTCMQFHVKQMSQDRPSQMFVSLMQCNLQHASTHGLPQQHQLPVLLAC